MIDVDTNNTIATIDVEEKKLIIFYSKAFDGAWQHFKTDAEMYDYIRDNLNQAFNCFLVKDEKEKIYWLNIASTENFGYFKWKGSPECFYLLKYQLDIFGPLIDNFIMFAKKGDL